MGRDSRAKSLWLAQEANECRPCAAANAGVRLQFRYAVHRHWPGLAELGSFSRSSSISNHGEAFDDLDVLLQGA